MNRQLLALLFIVGLGLSAVPALAGDEGPYLALHGGAVFVDEMKNSSASGSFNADLDGGYGAALALGYDLAEEYPKIGKGRLELELGYRSNPLGDVDFSQGKVAGAGDLTVTSLMVNSYVDVRDSLPWIPYGGIGVGVAEVSWDGATVAGALLVDGSDVVFAYQFVLGTALHLADGLALDFGYRYFGTADPSFTDAGGERIESRYGSHLLLAGVRCTF